MSLRWLHVSDLHAGGPGTALRNALMDALASDIQTMALEVGPPALILFTGDLAYSGEADEYAEVDGVLTRIRGWLAEVHPGAPTPLLFAVPGNHDLQRPRERRYKRECAILNSYDDGGNETIQELRMELWQEHDPALIAPMFAAFVAWQQRCVIAPLAQARDRGDRCHQVYTSFFPGDLSIMVESEGMRVALVGLNSSWLQYRGGDYRGQLHMPLEQFHAALPCDVAGDFFKDCDAALLVQHHPPNWLSPQGRAIFDSHIYKPEHFSLCLFGHMHEGRSKVESISGSEARHFFQAPSLFGLEHYGSSNESRAFGYAWGEIGKDGGVRIWPRRVVERSAGTAKFDRDTSFEPEPGHAYFWLRRPKDIQPVATGAKAAKVEMQQRESDYGQDLPRYLAWAHKQFGHLSMLGLGGGEFELGLEEVYVPLTLAPTGSPFDHGMHKGGLRTVELERAFVAAGDKRHVFIRGEPGMGKTTALKKLLWTMIDQERQRFDGRRLGLPMDTIPVFLRLRQLAGPGLDVEHGDFADTLDEALAKAIQPGFGKWLWQRGHLLLLLDGLDEIANKDSRRKACRNLERLARMGAERNVWLVASSRFAGIEEQGEVNLSRRCFLHLDVRPLDDAQIGKLIAQWYAAAGRARARMRKQREEYGEAEAHAQGQKLMVALKQRRGARMMEVMSTPMLLTLLCLVVERGGRMPERRVDFFHHCLEILLGSWVDERQGERVLSAGEALDLLAPLAWWMHTRGRKYDMSEREMRAELEKPIRALQDRRERGEKVPTFAKVRDWFCRGTGVLTEYAEGEYGFMHLNLQEYLAALYVARNGELEPMVADFGSDWWREVALLMVAMREHRMLGKLLTRVIPTYWATNGKHIEECIGEALNRELTPLLEIVKDRGRPVEQRLGLLRMVQEYSDEELLDVASELALDEETPGCDELRRVCEGIEARAPRLPREKESEVSEDDPGSVLVVSSKQEEEEAYGLVEKMREWGWDAEGTTDLETHGETDGVMGGYGAVVVMSGNGGSGPWCELGNRRALLRMVKGNEPIVLAMSGEENEVAPFLRAQARVGMGEIGAQVATMLDVTLPDGGMPVEGSEMERGRAHVVEATGTRLVWLPGGKMPMSAQEFVGFWLGETVVTNREYRAVMESAGLSEPEYMRIRRFNDPEQPVVGVSWYDAVAYCNALSRVDNVEECYKIEGERVEWAGGGGYRLPTESEWEYACRAGTKTYYWFGDDELELGKYVWYDTNSEGKLQPVGRKPANPWGLYDMHGNVWEWCWNVHRQNEIQEINAARVLRGGAFVDGARDLRSAYRSVYPPGRRGLLNGFRVARGGLRAEFKAPQST